MAKSKCAEGVGLDRTLKAWTRRFCRHLEGQINSIAERRYRGPGDVVESLLDMADAIREARLRASLEGNRKFDQAFQRRSAAAQRRPKGRKP